MALSAELSDVNSRLNDLELGLGGTDLESRLEDAEAALSDFCNAISLNYLYLSNSAIEELLGDLDEAC